MTVAQTVAPVTHVEVTEAPAHEVHTEHAACDSKSSDSSCINMNPEDVPNIPDESTIMLDLYHRLNSRDYYCIICSQLMSEHIICKLVPCMHTFHKVCVLQWFTHQYGTSSTYSCPMCRYETPNDAITIILNNISVRDGQVVSRP